MKAFYGSRFSPNMTHTPENYLICHNVPISRTGEYEYLGQELGIDEYHDKIVKVYRSPDEVFSNASIASFEGKPVTDEHPPTDVKPDNYNSYLKGITTNVRKGTGDQEDCLVADLIVYDPILQSEIEAGKREVSCGYDCTYQEREDGQYEQRQICGNHVAIVVNGRAGSRIAIKDSNTSLNLEQERSMAMSAKTNSILGKMLKAFAKDAEPEEIEKAMDEFSGMKKEQEEPTMDESAPMEDIMSRLEAIEIVLAKLVKTDETAHEEMEVKDELETLEEELESPEEQAKEELTKDDNGEESVTIPVEEMKDEEAEKTKEEVKATDSRTALLNTVKAMKPIIAAMKDPVERKKATDALVKSVRGQMNTKDGDKNYAKIDNAVKAKMTTDQKAADEKAEANRKLGAEIAAQYNPHYKKGVK